MVLFDVAGGGSDYDLVPAQPAVRFSVKYENHSPGELLKSRHLQLSVKCFELWEAGTWHNISSAGDHSVNIPVQRQTGSCIFLTGFIRKPQLEMSGADQLFSKLLYFIFLVATVS